MKHALRTVYLPFRKEFYGQWEWNNTFDINSRNSSWESSFFVARMRGNEWAVIPLLAQRVDTNIGEGYRSNPLIEAIGN